MSTLENSTFKPITEKWNTTTVDYFLYYKSPKCSDLTKYLHLPIKVEDVFTQHWLSKACLNVSHLQPEIDLILILPYWSLNRFGPFAI